LLHSKRGDANHRQSGPFHGPVTFLRNNRSGFYVAATLNLKQPDGAGRQAGRSGSSATLLSRSLSRS
jgi:hypothetical protein